MVVNKFCNCTVSFQPVFAVIGNSDSEEGRGHSFTASLHLSHADALKAAKGQGVFGADAPIKTLDAAVITVNHETFIVERQNLYKVQEHTAAELQQISETALAKLSPLEKEILGLNKPTRK